jgi:hypothetical protein
VKAKYVWRAEWSGGIALIRFRKLARARMRLEAPPIQISQAGLLMSVDRGRPEVSGIRLKRRDQPLTDVGYWHLVQRGAKFAVI